MKKISLLTIHVGFNFGSILQTIATAKLLNQLRYDVEVVNYIPERCTWKRLAIRTLKSPKDFILSFIKVPVIAINKKIFNSYLSKYLKVSIPIYKDDDFVSKCPKADIYLTGSDQVWNSIHNEGLDRRYYFDGFPQDTIKVSYSSSIGRETLDKCEYEEMKRMLRSYQAISVREASAKHLIEKMGYQVTHLLDPTFMLDKEAWSRYMSNRMIKEPYLLVYLPYNIHDKELIYRTVRRISQKKKLKVVTFAWHHVLFERLADKTIFFANPGDFLSLMYYADYVVTNSFHGTAFSINLQKQFLVYSPSKFGTRVSSILDLCALNSRLLKDNEVVSDDFIEDTIDYASVNSILETEREKTYTFLKNALK